MVGSGGGFISLSDIIKMLEGCAKGYTMRASDHSRLVVFKSRSHALPKGGHGKTNPDIQKTAVRKMVQSLLLSYTCVNGWFPDLMKPPKAAEPQPATDAS